jgi:hypothetical protein
MGLLLTGRRLIVVDNPRPLDVVPVEAARDALVLHPTETLRDVEDLTDPVEVLNQFVQRIVPLGNVTRPLLEEPTVARAALFQPPDLELTDKSVLYAGAIIEDERFDTPVVLPWAAIGGPNEPLIGLYNGHPTHYMTWDAVAQAPHFSPPE